MVKQKVNRRQLAEIVQNEVGVPGLVVNIARDPIYGWDAGAMVSPNQAINIHSVIQQAVARLRELYELED